ncbi:ornithine decarboxylase antizyme-domain-containing protein [Ampelomyces quisqualis]|uniref:Ornithine decarboxylase antizyme n=1 Tax=Ampelomyces quisqualis TaxID=50730 RepID=A0A6A5QU99_AMPQU|nr:ornithine decarboxylase antizyme-domain-containing protein [Ampelomyces quisqualis]
MAISTMKRNNSRQGIPSPPQSPVKRGFWGVAWTISESVRGSFCETLRSVFLGERKSDGNSLEMDMHCDDYGVKVDGPPARLTGSPEPETLATCVVSDWIEMWDYVGGIRLRGFVADQGDAKAMFVFFDQSVVAGDLKAGLMALLELCEVDHFSCDRLVVCIDRHAEQLARDTLVKDLGWIGFSLATLDDFSDGAELTSAKWLFMDMET